MSGINFLSENLVDIGLYNITTGSANAQFPIDNLQSDFTTKKFRSTGNTVVFEVDWQQFRNVDFIALAGDATSVLGVTAMSVKLSITTDFSSSLVYTVDINGENNIGFVGFTGVNARYAEVTVTGTGSYSEIGKLFIGEKVNLPQQSLSISSFKFARKDRSSIKSNKFGQKFIDVRNNTQSVSGSIQHMTADELDVIDQLFIDHGKNKPLWVIVDENGLAFTDSQYKLTMYVYITKDPNYSATGGKHYSVTMSMETVV